MVGETIRADYVRYKSAYHPNRIFFSRNELTTGARTASGAIWTNRLRKEPPDPRPARVNELSRFVRKRGAPKATLHIIESGLGARRLGSEYLSRLRLVIGALETTPGTRALVRFPITRTENK